MVVLTIVAKNNGETIFFEDPLPKVHLAKVISCNLHNSWFSLKKPSKVTFLDLSRNNKRSEYTFNHGFYTVKTFVDIMNNHAENNGLDFSFIENTPAGEFLAKNSNQKTLITFDNRSADLFTGGVRSIFGDDPKNVKKIFLVKHVEIPHSYFIHCDLVDKNKNLLNGKKSDLLAKFEIKGVSHEKVTYLSPHQDVYRECSTGNQVNSITLSVKDEHGEMFDFNGLEMDFVLDLN